MSDNDPDGEKYRGFRITEIYAIMGIDPGNDSEGLIAATTPLGMTPLISADPVRLQQMIQMAQEIADKLKQNFKIVRFSVREDICEIKSRTTS